jgi:hypothetical protein
MLPAGLLAALLAQEPAPLPEGNALVRGLVHKQRKREEALNSYSYDVLEVRDELDKKGGVTRRRTRLFEVFYVKGRPVRKLVAENGRALPPDQQAREERKVREQAEAIARGDVATEQPGIRLSSILELLRDLTGRIWVDEEEGEVVRARIRNRGGIKLGRGLGASLSSLELLLEFRKVDGEVWLPLRVEARVSGRMLLFKTFRRRAVASYDRYRRFHVDSQEEARPAPQPTPSPPP